jgi:2-polyprenyl-3-methyl-5-hydroxy-6-metoxy-1,4-benzoquinol methylase
MLRNYFDEFVGLVEQTLPLCNRKRVLDIGCNDGSQLAAFAAGGWETFGVDPAQNLAALSGATGGRVMCAYWTPQTAADLNMTFDAIVAQNVIAHVRNPLNFLQACTRVMTKGTKIFIQTSQAEMFQRGEFDAIYHEHVSYFSARSLQTLAERAGLRLEEIFTVPIHGGSYVFVLGFGAAGPSVTQRLAEEERQGRYRVEFYRDFGARARRIAEKLQTTIENELNAFRIVGFGAAAKGNTLLNFAKIRLAYIVDNNPLKHGLLTPGTNIPIRPPEHLTQDPERLAILVLAWNFLEEIRETVHVLRSDRDDVLITSFPEPALHALPKPREMS